MRSLNEIVLAIEDWNIRTEQMPADQQERIIEWKNNFDYYDLALAIFEEEVEEIYAAEDDVELLDAFADAFYTLVGMVVKAGMTEEFPAAVEEVIRSNESKLQGEREYLPNGKLGKGSEYSPPNIEGILKDHGWI